MTEPEKTPTDARQGIMLGRMRYVLMISTAAAVVALVAVYFAS